MKKRALIPVGVGACLAFGIFANLTGFGGSTVTASVKDVVSSDNNYLESVISRILPKEDSPAEKGEIEPSFTGAFIPADISSVYPEDSEDDHVTEDQDKEAASPVSDDKTAEIPADESQPEVQPSQEEAVQTVDVISVPAESEPVQDVYPEETSKTEESGTAAEKEVKKESEDTGADTSSEVKEENTGISAEKENEPADVHEHVLKPVYKTVHHDAVTHTETEYVETGFESSGGGSISYGDIKLSFGRQYSGRYDEDGTPVYDKYEKYFYINGEKASEEEYNEAHAKLYAEAEANGETDKIEGEAISGIWPRMEEVEKEIVDQEAYDEEVLDHYECEHCDEIADNI